MHNLKVAWFEQITDLRTKKDKSLDLEMWNTLKTAWNQLFKFQFLEATNGQSLEVLVLFVYYSGRI